MLYYHDFHAPDGVCVFTVPTAGVRRRDDQALVYDARFDHGALRHYAFADRWFVVNCSLDRDGRFISEPGPIAWTFNCDIATPIVWRGDALYHVDLALDVLVAADGREHVVIDEDDFAEAVRRGWYTAAERQGARRGLADLLGIIADGGLLPFLDGVYPFGSVADAPLQPAPTHKTLAEVRLLHLAARS